MKAKAPNGNDLVYRTTLPLDATVADACKMRNISMLTILSATESAPMTQAEAIAYVVHDFKKQINAPNTRFVQAAFGINDICCWRAVA